MQLSFAQFTAFILLDFVLGGLLGWAVAALLGRRTSVQVAGEREKSGERVARMLSEVSTLVGHHGDAMKRFDAVRIELESSPERAGEHLAAAHAEASDVWSKMLESRARELGEAIEEGWDEVGPANEALAKYQTLAADYAAQIGDGTTNPLHCPIVGELISNLLVANEQLSSKLEEARSALVDTDEQLRAAHRNARIDPLTGLPNRRAFDEQFERLIAKHTRDPKRPFTLTMIDIDHFKKLNDVHGHATGDAMLKIVANVLLEQCRSSDHLSRWGGEEFAILSENTNERSASIMANRLRVKIAGSRLNNDGTTVSCTVSGGVAAWLPELGRERLLERADEALYESKSAGRNTVRVAAEVDPEAEQATTESSTTLQPA